MDFTDKVIIITGGAQGIGKEIGLKFGNTKGIVNIFDINIQKAEKVRNEIREKGSKSDAYLVDVIDQSSVMKAVKQVVNNFGRIDILVNSAGIVNTKPFIDVEESDWDKVMNVNLKGVYHICREVFPIMIEQNYGKIINIASIAGKKGGGFFGNSVYGASKAGVIGLTKGLAREGGPYGINVNAVCPGPTYTKIIQDLKEEDKKTLINNIPLRRFAKPEDIANVVLFLSSDLAKHVSGEICDVDGGLLRD